MRVVWIAVLVLAWTTAAGAQGTELERCLAGSQSTCEALAEHEVDPVLKARLLRRACGGDRRTARAKACLGLTEILESNDKLNDDIRSWEYLQRACELLDTEGCAELARRRRVLLEEGRTKLVRECGRHGFQRASSCHELGTLASLDILETKPEQTRQALKAACDEGDPDACVGIALGTVSRLAMIERCELGEAQACRLAGGLFRLGAHNLKDQAEAVYLLERSCALNLGAGCRSLGEALTTDPEQNSSEIEVRRAKAFARGCDLDDAHACSGHAELLAKAGARKTAAEAQWKACTLGSLAVCRVLDREGHPSARWMGCAWGDLKACRRLETKTSEVGPRAHPATCRGQNACLLTGFAARDATSGCVPDRKAALVAFHRACEAGSDAGCVAARRAQLSLPRSDALTGMLEKAAPVVSKRFGTQSVLLKRKGHAANACTALSAAEHQSVGRTRIDDGDHPRTVLFLGGPRPAGAAGIETLVVLERALLPLWEHTDPLIYGLDKPRAFMVARGLPAGAPLVWKITASGRARGQGFRDMFAIERADAVEGIVQITTALARIQTMRGKPIR